MKKRILLPAIAVLAIIAAAIFYSVNRNGPAAEQRVVNVRLKWLFFANYAGAVVAKERGFFPASWTVNIHAGGFEADSRRLVAAKSDDFGITSALELLQARSKGLALVAIAAIYQKSPVSMLALKESGIIRVEQFLGHVVGVKYGTNTHLMYRVMLSRAGVSEDQVETVPVKFSTLPLVEGQVAIFPSYYMTDPVNLEAAGVSVVTINPDDYGIACYGNVLFTREDVVEEHPELVQEFVDAYRRGWESAVADPSGTAGIFTRLNPNTPVANQQKILERTIPFLTNDGSLESFGEMSVDTWQATIDLLIETAKPEDIERMRGLDARAAFTNVFIVRE